VTLNVLLGAPLAVVAPTGLSDARSGISQPKSSNPAMSRAVSSLRMPGEMLGDSSASWSPSMVLAAQCPPPLSWIGALPGPSYSNSEAGPS
jgi:hypothetical protein